MCIETTNSTSSSSSRCVDIYTWFRLFRRIRRLGQRSHLQSIGVHPYDASMFVRYDRRYRMNPTEHGVSLTTPRTVWMDMFLAITLKDCTASSIQVIDLSRTYQQRSILLSDRPTELPTNVNPRQSLAHPHSRMTARAVITAPPTFFACSIPSNAAISGAPRPRLSSKLCKISTY